MYLCMYFAATDNDFEYPEAALDKIDFGSMYLSIHGITFFIPEWSLLWKSANSQSICYILTMLRVL